MRLLLPLFAALALAGAARAEAPDAPLSGDGGRFSMTPADGGFLRLDKETGAVSFCSVKEGGAMCRASADERAALEQEINRLRTENAELKARGGAPAPRASGVPNEEEFERALSFTERFLRRIMRIFREEAPPGDRS